MGNSISSSITRHPSSTSIFGTMDLSPCNHSIAAPIKSHKDDLQSSLRTACTVDMSESSSSSSRSDGRVRFSDKKPSIHLVGASGYWFTKYELEKIKERNQLVYLLYAHGEPLDTDKHSLRGLESGRRRRPAQWLLCHQDNPDMALAYHGFSRPAARLAWRRAQSDAAYVHAMEDELIHI